jgi:hypothetical protein
LAEEKRRKPNESEPDKDAFEAGRILGVIARRNPDLYRAVKELTELEGAKLTDLIEDALQMYVEFKYEAPFMPKQVFYAMKLIERVSRWLVINMGEFMKLAVSMMSAMLGYAEEEEEKEKERKPSVPAELRAKMLEAFAPLMQSLITMLMTSVTRAFAPQLPQQVQMATAPAPPASKPIKVVSSKKKESSAESTP